MAEAHPLVNQLHFTRRELRRGLAGVGEDEARRRLLPMNCISWMIAHLAFQEHAYWVHWAQGEPLDESLGAIVQAGDQPPLAEAWATWQAVTAAADRYLSTLTVNDLDHVFTVDGRSARESVGTLLLRNTYHYWFHLGEAMAVRQQLGHTDLPQFVGGIGRDAPYRPG